MSQLWSLFLNSWHVVIMLSMNDEHRVGTDRGTPLSRDISFWGMSILQFLGAFNDNLYKQLMLLRAIPVGVASLGQDQQDLETIVFSLPFVLFSVYAGFLSDRYSKKTIIVISKFAEIAAMALGLRHFWPMQRLDMPACCLPCF